MDFRRNTKWLERILSTVPEIVLVVDRAGVIQYINRLEVGYEMDEVVGESSATFLFPDSTERFQAALDAVLETGETQEFEVKASLADGTSGWYRSEMLPLLDDGEVVGAVVMAMNISELKAAEEEADRLRRLLPICSWCDRIRTEEGTWESTEEYLTNVADTTVSHGICPDCYEQQAGETGDGTNDAASG